MQCFICRSRKPTLLYQINSYKYFYCPNCHTLFLHPLPAVKKVKQYYQSDFQYSAGKAEETRIRKRARSILKKLKEFCPEGKTLLDIGSGYGYFLDEAGKLGLKTVGIEPSKQLYRQSVKRSYKGLFLNQTFEKYIIKHKNIRFDFIAAIHVIEHISNPILFISQASKLLNRNGILYIETPNYNSWLAKAEKERYTFLTPPDHIWLFSSKSLQLIVVRILKLHIKSISTYSYPEHFMGILKKKLQMTNNKLQINHKSQILNNKKKIKSFTKILKYALFDKLIAPLFTPLLNMDIYGSILELYIAKI